MTVSTDSGSMPWRASVCCDGFRLRRNAHAFAGAFVALIAKAGFDEDGALAGADQVAIESLLDAVEFVGLEFAAPEGFGDHAKDGAAIPPIGSGANRGRFRNRRGASPYRAGVSRAPICARDRTARRRLRRLCGRVRTCRGWLRRCLWPYPSRPPCHGPSCRSRIWRGVLAALWRVENRHSRADNHACQEPGDPVRPSIVGLF